MSRVTLLYVLKYVMLSSFVTGKPFYFACKLMKKLLKATRERLNLKYQAALSLAELFPLCEFEVDLNVVQFHYV